MFKRLVIAASVSVVAFIGLGPAAGASADTATQDVSVKAVQYTVKSPGRIIDWDAPAPAPGDGGATTQRIDWD